MATFFPILFYFLQKQSVIFEGWEWPFPYRPLQFKIKLSNPTLKHLVAETNSSMVTIMNERQRDMEEKMAQVEGFVGWEYSRTTEWSSRHGTISFDRMLIDYSEGAYEVHNCTVCFQKLVTF